MESLGKLGVRRSQIGRAKISVPAEKRRRGKIIYLWMKDWGVLARKSMTIRWIYYFRCGRNICRYINSGVPDAREIKQLDTQLNDIEKMCKLF